MEDDLADARSNLATKEVELDSVQNRLRQIEEQQLQAQLESIKNKNEIEALTRDNETMRNDLTEKNKLIDQLKKRQESLEETLKEFKRQIEHAKSEVDFSFRSIN